jgi:hypothetical protein
LNAGRRIALVNVWFGPLPFYMPAFLLTCRWNPEVDWLIFSDAPPPPNLPDNVRFLPLDMETLNRRSSEALGCAVRLTPSFAYKMCDLKLMYGLIFQQELQGYDFWGCCDMDIVWGSIKAFVTTSVLEGHDVITSRVGRISGHFCLFRNRPEWATLFRRVPNVAGRLAESDRYTGIDENGLTDVLQGYQSSRFRRFWTSRVRGLPLPRVYWERVLTSSGKHQRQMLADPSLRMRWREGRTFGAHGEEMMYLHFHDVRKYMKGIDFGYGDAPREFTVSPAGIFSSGS